MKYLILTSGKENEKNSTESRLRDELIRRGHEVCLTDIFELAEREASGGEHHEAKRSPFSKLKVHQSYHILAPALKRHLRSHSYQAVLATKLIAAQAVSAVLQSEEAVPAFAALVSTEYDSLPRKAELFLDEYITMSKRAISIMIDWGMDAKRIHFVEVSDHTIQELCDVIEPLASHWRKVVHELQAAQLTQAGEDHP